MPRIPLLPDDGLDDMQRVVYDKITSGPRGMLVGPLRAALHSPELADRWQLFGEFLRYRSSLDNKLSELAIIVCGRYWNSEVEWYVHSELALKAGLSLEAIMAIRSLRPPRFCDEQEAVVYEYARQLTHHGRVSDSTYDRALELLGTVTLVELTALIGYYTMVAMTLNAHQVPSPDPDPALHRTLSANHDDSTCGPSPLAAGLNGAEFLRTRQKA